MKKIKKKRWLSVFLCAALISGSISANLIASDVSDGTTEIQTQADDGSEAENSTLPGNPRIVTDSTMDAGQKVIWDCIYFGYYPQTEIVDQESRSGVYGKPWKSSKDFIVDKDLYNRLKTATEWDENGDISLDGVRYRRIRSSQATYTETNSSSYYEWKDTTTYHYFRHDKIKWRVLSVSENIAFLIADTVLDSQQYYPSGKAVTWSNSTIRSWLNGYDSSCNKYGNNYSDKNFIDIAFTQEEQGCIQDSSIVNDNNIQIGTAGGNATTDKIFLLSEKETYTGTACPYGFVSAFATYDNARKCKSSTYGKAMGVQCSVEGTVGNNNGYCNWFLRSPGSVTKNAANVTYDGNVAFRGYNVDKKDVGIRPALKLDLSSSSWTQAGIVCSKGGELDYSDEDGDGLYDQWEREGADTDLDGIVDVHLEQMGADPQKPDVFVEVDWMVQPEKHFLWVKTQERVSLAPSQNAMRTVYNVFKDHGINLHIDVGPSSTDFVTGKSWGNLSGGNEISYQKDFTLGDDYEEWMSFANDNFSESRRAVFKHAMFINTYDNTTSSGISDGIPGQYFIVANQQWVRDTGDVGLAGTFMHELGHTLGLSHGGTDDNGNLCHEMYNPNYLSVMNYSFQTSGLIGTDEVNYSEYRLPTLDESALNESDGVDPDGQTEGTGLGTKILSTNETIDSISGKGIDFNGDSAISEETVYCDVNLDGKTTKLYSSVDWDYIRYKSGMLGVISEGNTNGSSNQQTGIRYEDELTLEEALENHVLSSNGTGALEAVGPFTLVNGVSDQNIYLRVKNMGTEDAAFTVKIKESKLTEETIQTVQVAGTQSTISYQDLPVCISKLVADGKYSIEVILSYPGKEDVTLTIPITIYSPSKTEIVQLSEALDGDTDLEENVVREYEEIIEKYPERTPVASEKNKNAIQASNIVKTYSSNSQSFYIDAKCSGNAALTYASNNKYIRVNGSGKVTVNAKYIGSARITIKSSETDTYKSAEKVITVTVNPRAVSGFKLSKGKKVFTAKWKKDTTQTTGYQIRYSTNSTMSRAKTVTIKSSKSTSKKIKKLMAKKTYYVQVRRYKTVGGKNYYSSWTSKKAVKTR